MNSDSAATKINFPLFNFPFPPQLLTLSKILLKNGDELRLVGGCVRDFLLQKPFSDIDLVCKYRPEELVEILNKHKIKNITTAAKYGTIIAVISGKNFEITTLRRDVANYGRHADVVFTDDFAVDAARRDFTINALYLDFAGNCYDYFGGIDDLKNQKLRFIGDAAQRIEEDYLRILRFFRFSCYYSQNLDIKGLQASLKFKNQLKTLSADRIRNEILKILKCPRSPNLLDILQVMNEEKILDLLFETVNIDLSVLKNFLDLQNIIEPGKVSDEARFAAMIFQQKNDAEKILAKLNFSNANKKYIATILNQPFSIDLDADKYKLYELLYQYDRQLLIDSLAINLSAISVQNNSIINQEITEKFIAIKKFILSANLPKFFLTGHDLLRINLSVKEISKTIKKARTYWIAKDFKPDLEEIIYFLNKDQTR